MQIYSSTARLVASNIGVWKFVMAEQLVHQTDVMWCGQHLLCYGDSLAYFCGKHGVRCAWRCAKFSVVTKVDLNDAQQC